MELKKNPQFIHHRDSKIQDSLREIVFGAEDGMVSTLGALTGIAVATESQFTVILAGFIIVSVESIAMSVGSYLSNKSVREVDLQKLHEEKIEIKSDPAGERRELREMFVRDGWPAELANQMSEVAASDDQLMFREMAYRELGVSPNEPQSPIQDSLFMFLSYVVGGLVPVAPYLLLSVEQAFWVSIIITLSGLFCLGVATTIFTKRNWIKSGLEMLVLASAAALIGYVIGQLVPKIL